MTTPKSKTEMTCLEQVAAQLLQGQVAFAGIESIDDRVLDFIVLNATKLLERVKAFQ